MPEEPGYFPADFFNRLALAIQRFAEDDAGNALRNALPVAHN